MPGLTPPSIMFDDDRAARIGLPEAVFCQGKSAEAIEALLYKGLEEARRPILFTRLAPEMFDSMPGPLKARYDYHSLSRTAYAGVLPRVDGLKVAVVSAGTADGPVTFEAARTLEYPGYERHLFEDTGVAGLWRLMKNLDSINDCDLIIAVAGLDAALVSVLGGLTPRPIIAVPTSVGYGLAKKGEAALASMLISCAQGVTVMNIDNGFGAACAAARIGNLLMAARGRNLKRADETFGLIKLAM